MNPNRKFSFPTALLVIVGAALAMAQPNPTVTNGACCVGLTNPVVPNSLAATNAPATSPQKVSRPKLIDLGAGKCIPCKMMAPILKQLKTNYVGALEVESIDVWKNPDAGKQYRVEIIPTQIFCDANGKEMFRHIGFFAKEDILAKWKELGVDLSVAK